MHRTLLFVLLSSALVYADPKINKVTFDPPSVGNFINGVENVDWTVIVTSATKPNWINFEIYWPHHPQDANLFGGGNGLSRPQKMGPNQWSIDMFSITAASNWPSQRLLFNASVCTNGPNEGCSAWFNTSLSISNTTLPPKAPTILNVTFSPPVWYQQTTMSVWMVDCYPPVNAPVYMLNEMIYDPSGKNVIGGGSGGFAVKATNKTMHGKRVFVMTQNLDSSYHDNEQGTYKIDVSVDPIGTVPPLFPSNTFKGETMIKK
eukprot:TRINITY_DN69135_c0_g1_i1.p1 TRINITY_DN69135_c0_g1~~TRINITY_DN69135_c0_g1_i1.p1  ORF type:complete len:261 (-),score=18.66 TRINITY_DN69135_c0_g1_i1:667-1449(-)